MDEIPDYDIKFPVINCKLSSWSPWSTCSALCGEGRRTRSRYIIQMPQNGGKPCDKKLSRTQKCKNLPPCPPDYNQHNPPAQQNTHVKQSHKAGHKQHNSRGSDWRTTSTTSTTTTTSGSMMDDEDDSKFSRLQQSESSIGQNEIRLLGSTSFHIKGGFLYLISDSNTTTSSNSNSDNYNSNHYNNVNSYT